MAAAGPSQERERPFVVGRPQVIEVPGELCDRLVPCHRPELTRAARAGPLDRPRQPIRMVGDLDAGLASSAKGALIDRMGRRALEFLGHAHLHDAEPAVSDDFGVGLHDAHLQAAAGLAERADAWLPFRDTRHELIIGNEANELVLRGATAGERGGRAAHGRELDERASVHGQGHTSGHRQS